MQQTNVLQFLEQTAARVPDKTAFADEAETLGFAALQAKAEAIGTALAQRAAPRAPIAFLMEKSALCAAGFLGAVYAGCFYTLLEPKLPAVRLAAMLETLRPAALCTDAQHAEAARALGCAAPVVVLEQAAETLPDAALLAEIRAGALDIDPLYANFTSGSTGVPKAVVVSHRSVLDFIPVFVRIMNITEADVLGNQAPFDFDVSVKDFYCGLYTGASVHLIPRPYFSQPAKLMDFLAERRVTTLIWAVSALCFVTTMNGLAYRVPQDVNKVIFSGEVMPVKHLNLWRAALPNAQYVNVYGPTEITCNCTYYKIERAFSPEETLPIGKAFPNEKVFLLDENDCAVTAPGAQGELCVSGTALALGYYNDPVRTAEHFVQNPLNRAYLEPIYRTGDLACYNEAGELIYLSRKDFQIKHMGHRIELGEIDAALERTAGVSRACCVYEPTKKRLLVFYSGTAEKKEAAAALRTALPAYMQPNTLTRLEALPLTKNGKTDRAALLRGYYEQQEAKHGR